MLGSLFIRSLRGVPFGFLLHAGVIQMACHIPVYNTAMPELPAFTCPELDTRHGFATVTFLLLVEIISLE